MLCTICKLGQYYTLGYQGNSPSDSEELGVYLISAFWSWLLEKTEKMAFGIERDWKDNNIKEQWV